MTEPMSELEKKAADIVEAIAPVLTHQAADRIATAVLALNRAEADRLAAENERLRRITDAVEQWRDAYDLKASTLAAWQAERLSGITSATPAYDAMNDGYLVARDASDALRAALASGEREAAT